MSSPHVHIALSSPDDPVASAIEQRLYSLMDEAEDRLLRAQVERVGRLGQSDGDSDALLVAIRDLEVRLAEMKVIKTLLGWGPKDDTNDRDGDNGHLHHHRGRLSGHIVPTYPIKVLSQSDTLAKQIHAVNSPFSISSIPSKNNESNLIASNSKAASSSAYDQMKLSDNIHRIELALMELSNELQNISKPNIKYNNPLTVPAPDTRVATSTEKQQFFTQQLMSLSFLCLTDSKNNQVISVNYVFYSSLFSAVISSIVMIWLFSCSWTSWPKLSFICVSSSLLCTGGFWMLVSLKHSAVLAKRDLQSKIVLSNESKPDVSAPAVQPSDFVNRSNVISTYNIDASSPQKRTNGTNAIGIRQLSNASFSETIDISCSNNATLQLTDSLTSREAPPEGEPTRRKKRCEQCRDGGTPCSMTFPCKRCVRSGIDCSYSR